MIGVEAWVLDLAGSPWTFPVLAFVLAIGSIVVFLPSQTLVIALGTLLLARPDGWLALVPLFLASSVGMIVGDGALFLLVRRVGVHALPLLSRGRVAKTRASISRRFSADPIGIIVTGRFLPLGRLTTGVLAADDHLPPRRFALASVLAGTAWSAYCIAISAFAGIWAQKYPFVTVVIAVAVSIVLGLIAHRVDQWWTSRRIRALPAATAAPAPAASAPAAADVPANP